jgi:hypothetical protein
VLVGILGFGMGTGAKMKQPFQGWERLMLQRSHLGRPADANLPALDPFDKFVISVTKHYERELHRTCADSKLLGGKGSRLTLGPIMRSDAGFLTMLGI